MSSLNYGLIKRTTMCYLKVVWRLNNPICVRQDPIFYTVCRDLFHYVLWSELQYSSFLLYLTLQANIGQDIYSLWGRDGRCWDLELSFKFCLFDGVRCHVEIFHCTRQERKMVPILTCSWDWLCRSLSTVCPIAWTHIPVYTLQTVQMGNYMTWRWL